MSDKKESYSVAIVAPTTFHYQAPLFRSLAAHPRIDLIVYVCSDEAISGQEVLRTYKTEERWGVEDEMLDGYNHKFLRNYAFNGSYLKWPFGLVNLGIISEIKKSRPDVVILMAWTNPTWYLAILACLICRIPYLYMTDANIQPERARPRWKRVLKRILLRYLVFQKASGFLSAGTSNNEFYRYYGVPDEKLVPFAFSWGYDRLLYKSAELTVRKKELRMEMGIPEDEFVLMYCGRLSKEKGTSLLLDAFRRANPEKTTLLFVGDGDLRESLETYVHEHHMGSVRFCGFQNRVEIPKVYTVADGLVLPSFSETWGIVVNEAMCFSLPLIVSDQVGSTTDMLKEGYNGFLFPSGDAGALAESILKMTRLSKETQKEMAAGSLELIQKWISRDLGESLVNYIDSINSSQRERTV
jgi:glycosyltransferase involved in cell wall biosynthesis